MHPPEVGERPSPHRPRQRHGGAARRHRAARALPNSRVRRALGAIALAVGALALGAGLGAPGVAGAGPSWSPVPAMHEAICRGRAVPLPGGRVLVAGGGSCNGGPARAALFDPGSGGDPWTTTDPPSGGTFTGVSALAALPPRGGCANCGKDLVQLAGPSGKSRWVLFDPAQGGAGHWEDPATTGRPHQQRDRGAAVAVLDSGSVLVVGGTNDQQPASERQAIAASAEIFDPAVAAGQPGQWRDAAAPSSGGHVGAMAATLGDGRVLVFGGSDGAGRTAPAQLYDAAHDSWSGAASPAGTVSAESASFLRLEDGRLLVVGADGQAQAYSAAGGSGTWSATAACPCAAAPAEPPTLTALPTGKVLAVGARAAALFDPRGTGAGSWAAVEPLPASLPGHAAAVLPAPAGSCGQECAEVLVAGGDAGGAGATAAFRLSPESGGGGTTPTTGSPTTTRAPGTTTTTAPGAGTTPTSQPPGGAGGGDPLVSDTGGVLPPGPGDALPGPDLSGLGTGLLPGGLGQGSSLIPPSGFTPLPGGVATPVPGAGATPGVPVAAGPPVLAEAPVGPAAAAHGQGFAAPGFGATGPGQGPVPEGAPRYAMVRTGDGDRRGLLVGAGLIMLVACVALFRPWHARSGVAAGAGARAFAAGGAGHRAPPPQAGAW